MGKVTFMTCNIFDVVITFGGNVTGVTVYTIKITAVRYTGEWLKIETKVATWPTKHSRLAILFGQKIPIEALTRQLSRHVVVAFILSQPYENTKNFSFIDFVSFSLFNFLVKQMNSMHTQLQSSTLNVEKKNEKDTHACMSQFSHLFKVIIVCMDPKFSELSLFRM